MVQLDGGNTIIGTEFIKLLATGSSNLATEQYVNTAIMLMVRLEEEQARLI